MTPEQIASTYDAFEICLRRWMATWLDFFVFIAVGFALAALGSRNLALEVSLGILVLALYYPLLEGLTGRTFGKLLCGLKVVDEKGRVPGLRKGITRSLLRLVELNLVLFGALPAAIAVFCSRTRQRMGDGAARTYVLRNEDFRYLQLPGSPTSLGEFTLPDASSVTAPPLPVAGYAAPAPGMRPARLPASRFWALPGTALVTVLAIGLGYAAVQMSLMRERAKPPTLTFAKFAAAPPAPGWYRLTGCELVLEKVQYEVTSTDTESTTDSSDSTSDAAEEKPPSADKIGTLYLPVVAAGGDHEQKARLLLETNDNELRKLLADAGGLKEDDAAARKSWNDRFAKHTKNRELIGVIDTDPGVSLTLNDQLKSLEATDLKPGYRVMHEGRGLMEGWYNAVWVAALIVSVVGAAFWLAALIALMSGGPTNPRRPPPMQYSQHPPPPGR